MNNLAFSYARCSTKEQLKGASIERQMENAKEFCRLNKLELSEDGYVERGVSAFTEANLKEGSELYALMKAIENGAIPTGSTLVIENLDRLSRSFITTSLPLFMRIIDAGVRIATLSDGKIYDKEAVNKNPMELLFSIMIFARAHEESAVKKDRIRDAWKRAQAKAATEKIANSYPSWLRLKENKFTEIKEKADLVRRIFRQYVTGGSIAGISRQLNQEGIPTFNGKKWLATSVKYLLRSPTVIGEYHPGRRDERKRKIKTGQIVEGYYPEIVGRDVWNKAQAKFLLNPSRRGRPQAEGINLFSGIIVCPYCGGSMGIFNGEVGKSFICWNSVNGGCIRVHVSREFVEAAVLTSTIQIAKNIITESSADNEELRTTEGAIIDAEQRLANLIALSEKVGDASVIAPRIDKLSAEIKRLKTKLDELRAFAAAQSSLPKGLSVIKKVVQGDATPSERLSLIPVIRRLVSKVECFSVGNRLSAYQKAIAGKNGSMVYRRIRQELEVEKHQTVKVHFRHPILVKGKLTDSVDIDRKALGMDF